MGEAGMPAARRESFEISDMEVSSSGSG